MSRGEAGVSAVLAEAGIGGGSGAGKRAGVGVGAGKVGGDEQVTWPLLSVLQAPRGETGDNGRGILMCGAGATGWPGTAGAVNKATAATMARNTILTARPAR